MSPEEYHAQITDEFMLRLTAYEMAKLLANIKIKVENSFYLDELGENLCSLLDIKP